MRAQSYAGAYNVGYYKFTQTLVFNPATGKLYTGDGCDIARIDPYTGSAVALNRPYGNYCAFASPSFDNYPTAIAINAVTNRIYYWGGVSDAGLMVYDGNTDALLAQIKVATQVGGTGPMAGGIVVNPLTNKIYVVGLMPQCGGTCLAVIDGATNAILKYVFLGFSFQGMAINPQTGRIYMTTFNSSNVYVYDTTTDTVIASPSFNGQYGDIPEVIAVNTVTNTIYISYLYGVAVLDGATNTFLANVKTPYSGGPSGVESNQAGVVLNPVTNKAYFTGPNNGTAQDYLLDGATNAYTRWVIGASMSHTAVNPMTNRAWAVESYYRGIYSNNGSLTDTTVWLPLSSSFAVQARGIAIDPISQRIYTGWPGWSEYDTFDDATNKTSSVALGSVTPSAVAVNPATGRVYVANKTNNNISVTDGSTLLSTVNVGTSPSALAVDPIQNKIYVANIDSNNVSIMDGSTNSATTVTVGSKPAAIAVNPISGNAYVANNAANTVSVIANQAVAATISVGAGPSAVAVQSNLNKIYVANSGSNSISMIDGATNLVANFAVGNGPSALAINAVTGRLFVANKSDNTLSIFNTATGQVETTLTTGSQPSYIAVNARSSKVYVGNSDGSISVFFANASSASSILTFAAPAAGGSLVGLNVNQDLNKVYATYQNGSSSFVRILDGRFDSEQSLTVNGAAATALNADAGKLYIADGTNGALTVMTANDIQTIPLTTTISAVRDSNTVSAVDAPVFRTTNTTPQFTVTVKSEYSTSATYTGNARAADPIPTALYYRVDNNTGQWSVALPNASANPATFSLTLPTTSVGLHTLYVFAAYGAEAGLSGSYTGYGNQPEIGNIKALPFQVEFPAATTTTTIARNINPQQQFYDIQFTATVSPSTATGSVLFLDSWNGTTTALGTAPLSSGVATLTKGLTGRGAHTVIAMYQGDTAYQGSIGTTSETIYAPDDTAVSVSASPSSAQYPTPSTITVSVTDATNPATTPAGTVAVSVTSGSTTTQLETYSFSGGSHSLSFTPSAVGSYTVTAAFTPSNTSALYPSSGSTTILSTPAVVTVPATNVGSTSSTTTVQVNFSSTTTLNSTLATAIRVVTQGVTGLDYAYASGGTCTPGTTYSAGTGCSVNITFSPLYPGTRPGAILLFDNSVTPALASTAYLTGTGKAPLYAYSKGQASVLQSGTTIMSSVYDAGGTLYYIEQGTGTLKKVVSGTTSTVMSGISVPTGVALDGAGNLFYGSSAQGKVYKISTGGTTATQIASVAGADVGMSADAQGNIYVPGSAGITKLTLNGGSYTTSLIASGFGATPAVVVDASGNAYFSDFTNGKIYYIPAGSSIDQTATPVITGLTKPRGLALDAAGNLFVSTEGAVYKFTAGTWAQSTVATGYSAGALQIDQNANLYLSSNSLIKIDRSITPTLDFGSYGNGRTTAAQTVGIDNSGNTSLTFSSVSVANNFVLSSNTCTTSAPVAAGSSCILGAAFAPTETGTISGSVVLTHNTKNAAGSTSTVALSGISTPTTPQTITFDDVASPIEITVDPITLAFSASSSLPVTMTVSGPATLSGTTLTITGSGTVTLTATQDGNDTYAAAPPVTHTIVVTPRVSYGAATTAIGQTSATGTAIVTFNTAGTLGAIKVLTQGVENADFNFINGGTCTIGTGYAAGTICSVKYNFAPTLPGKRLGAIALYDNAATPSRIGVAYLGAKATGPLSVLSATASVDLATIDYIGDMVTDGSGNIFATVGGAIKKITPAGVVSDVATGSWGSAGIAVDGAGDIYFTAGTQLWRISAGTTTPVVMATIASADNDLAIDTAGNLYLQSSGTVRKLAAGTFAQSVVVSGLGRSIGLALDADDNLFIADFDNSKIYKAASGATTATTIVSNDPLLDHPHSINVDVAGNLYVGDYLGDNGVLRFAAGSYASTVIGSGFHVTASALDNAGNLYAYNRDTGKIIKYARALPFIKSLSTPPGISTNLAYTLENAGNSDLTLTALTADTGLSLSSDTGACTATSVLASGAGCALNFSYESDSEGTFSNSISITSNTLNASATVQTLTLNASVTKLPQTVTFSQPTTPLTMSAGLTGTVSATASSGLAVTYSVVSGPATISGDVVTFTGFGTVVIAADQTGNVTYSAAPTVTRTIVVQAVPQTITFSQPTTPVNPGDSFTLAATASSGLPVAYSISGPATLSDNTITYAGAGTVTITASQAGDNIYSAATPVSFTVTVNMPSLTPSTAPNTNVGSTSATQTATVTFIDSGTTASTTAAAIQIVTSGAVGGDFAYVPGGSCSAAASMLRGQTCTVNYTFTPSMPGARNGAVLVYNDATPAEAIGIAYLSGTGVGSLPSFPFSAIASLSSIGYPSDAAIDLAGNLYVADSSNNRITRIAPDGTTNYAVTGVNLLTGVGLDGAGNLYYGSNNTNALYKLAAGSTTPVAIATSITTDNSLVVDGAGNLYVQSGNSIVRLDAVSYNRSTISFGDSVGRVIGMTMDAAGLLYFADFDNNKIYTLNLTSGTRTLLSSGGLINAPHSLAVDPAGNVYVSNFGGGIVRLAVGTYTQSSLATGFSSTFIKIGPDGSLYIGNRSAGRIAKLARPSSTTFSYADTAVNSTSATQSTSIENIGNADLSLPAFSITDFTLSSGDSACISSGTLAISNSCTIGASFSPASYGVKTQTVTFSTTPSRVLTLSATATARTQSIQFNEPPTPWLTADRGQTMTLDATATSGLSVTYAITGPATLSGETLTFTGIGTVTITASQAGNTVYAAADPVTRTMTIDISSQTISFTQPVSPVEYAPGLTATLTATSDSGLPVTFSIVSGPATVSGNIVSFTAPGTVVIAADQAGSSHYTAATTVTHTVVVNKTSQTITFPQPTTPLVISPGLTSTMTATASSGLAVTYSVVSGPATISGNVVTFTADGAVVIAADQPGDTTYAAAPTVTQTIVVQKTAQTIDFPQPTTPLTISPGLTTTLTATASSGLAVTYSVVSGPATLNENTLTYTGLGHVVVRASQSGDAYYYPAADVDRSIDVAVPATLSLTVPDTNVNASSAIQTATVNLYASTGTSITLHATSATAIQVTTTGTANLDFQLASGGTCSAGSTYTNGASCTVAFTFSPVAPGFRRGAIVVRDTSGNVVGTTELAGKGIGPAIGLGGYNNIRTINLGYPSDAAIDAAGNLYVNAAGDSKIVRIAPDGTTTDLVTGMPSLQGIGIDGAGNLFFTSADRLFRLEAGSTTAVQVATVSGADNSVVMDAAGNLYIPTNSDGSIIKVTAGRYLTSTYLASNDIGRIIGMTVDNTGTLYFAGFYTNAIYKLAPADTTPTMIASGGNLANPHNISIDAAGNLYVANFSGGLVKLAAGTYAQTLLVSSGQGTIARVLDNGDLYFGSGPSGTVTLYQRTSALTFPATPKDARSAEQAVAVENIGNTDLTIGTLAAPTGFDLTGASTTCSNGSVVAAGTSCALGVVFAPSTIGALSGNVQITSNALNLVNGVRTLSVSGQAVSQLITFPQPPSPVYAGSDPYTLTATSTSGLPVSYSVTGPATLNGSQIQYLSAGTVTITASQPGDGTYSAADPVSVTVTVEASPSAFAAPATSVGSSSETQSAIVTFWSGGTLAATDSAAFKALTRGEEDRDFKFVSGGTCTAGATYNTGDACSVHYTFTPSTAGERQGAIVLMSNDATPLRLGTAYLAGTGQAPLGIFRNTASSSVVANFNTPGNAAIDADGNLFVTSSSDNTVSKIDTAGVVTTLATVSSIRGIALDGAGNILFGTSDGIQKMEGATGTPASVASIANLWNGMAVDGQGRLFIATTQNYSVQNISRMLPGTTYTAPSRFDPDGWSYNVSLYRVNGLAYDVSTDRIWAVDSYAGRIAATPGVAQYFTNSGGITIDASGARYVTSPNGLYRFDPNSYTNAAMDASGYNMSFVVAGAKGELYVGDTTNNRILKYDRFSNAGATIPDTAMDASTLKTISFDNAGTTDLTISNIGITGEFTTTSNTTCSTSTVVAAGSSCIVEVAFSPTSVGAKSGVLSITTNSLNTAGTVQTLTLTANALRRAQTITFPQPVNPASYYAGAQVTLSATASSGLPITYSVTGPATLSGNVLTYTGTGTLTITASQVGNTDYQPAPDVSYTIDVVSPYQTIIFASLPDVTFGNTAPIANLATVNSGLPITYSVTGPAQMISGKLVITGPGVITITATQPGDANYPAATPVSATFKALPASFTSLTHSNIPTGTDADGFVTLHFNETFTLGSLQAIALSSTTSPYTITSGGTCTVGTTYNASDTCTVHVIFHIAGTGLVSSTIAAYDNSATPMLEAAVNVMDTRYR